MGKSMAMSDGALEVVLSWSGAVQKAELFHGEQSLVTVGEGADASFMLPSEIVRDRLVLAEREGSAWLVCVPAAAVARIDARDASGTTRLVDLATVPCDAEGTRRVRLTDGMRADVELGAFTFHLRTTDKPEKAAMAPVRFDRRAVGWLAASIAVHMVLLGSMLMVPPDGHALSMDLNAEQIRQIQYRLTSIERVDPEPEPTPESGNQQNGSEGAPAPGEAGTVGDQNHHEKRGGLAVRGQSNRQLIPRTAQQVRESGILGVLAAMTGEMHEISSPYGAENAIGMADRDLFGRFLSDPGIGEGTNGLTMVGTGRGGGCREGDPNCVSGGIGVGNLATIGGHGTCTPAEFDRIAQTRGRAAAAQQCGGIGPGTGTDIGGGPRRPRAPTLRVLPPETIGGLSREQVRRTVSLHRNEVSFCYERALIGHPDLAGRVAVNFMIQPSGAVQSSVISQTTLNQSAAEECIASAVRRWSFPQSMGPTVVTYPFLFENAGGAQE